MKLFLAATALVSVASAIAISRADPVECSPQKNSTAPEPSSNTYDAFMEFALYREMSSTALEPTGYQVEFVNFIASIMSPGYIAFFDLDSYNVDACAEICDKTIGCGSFNIYFQRNPSVTPGVECPNPKANVLARCGIYSGSIYAEQAVNFGQFRGPEDSEGEAFHVAIRGSNGYNKRAATSDTTTISVTVTVTAPCIDESTATGSAVSPLTQTISATVATTTTSATIEPSDGIATLPTDTTAIAPSAF